MKLNTSYLGFDLKNPLIAGSSPLSGSYEGVKSLEDGGAACVVMHSLFEEQITHERLAYNHFMCEGVESYAESLSYLPEPESLNNLDAEHYLEEIAALKRSIAIPLIASINGVSPGGWIRYARKLQEAGADAIELNITYVPTDPALDGRAVEEMYLEDLRIVAAHTTLPVSVKMNPHFSAPAHMAKAFEREGARGVVLFDRPVRADIDLENLTARHRVSLSTSEELSEGLRWAAILYKELNISISLSTGVHTHQDVLKAIMSGADAVQMAAALLRHGPGHVGSVLAGLSGWMEQHEYESISQMKGSLSLAHCPDKSAYQRANYMHSLQQYRP
jgi:dihydroorotate dehydrogenase (fumarate)